MSTKAKSTITTSIIVVVILGTLNNVYKHNKLPGLRFYFGNAVLYLLLSMFGQAEEELTKSIAVAIAVFAVLGEGGGVIDHFMGKGAASKTLNTTPKEPSNPQVTALSSLPGMSSSPNDTMPTTVGAPGLFPIKPVIPNSVVIHQL